MKIISVEPTPSPNSMKLNMDECLEKGKSYNFSKERSSLAPKYIQKLLDIPGVKGVFQVNDFIALDRNAKVDWQQILSHVQNVFEDGKGSTFTGEEDNFGEVRVFVQFFKSIPMQIKLTTSTGEHRKGLPPHFQEAVLKAQSHSENVVVERGWVDKGIRYGEIEEVAEHVREELLAIYTDARLQRLVERAISPISDREKEELKLSLQDIKDAVRDPNWKVRYAALNQLPLIEGNLDILEIALKDEKMSIRRLATAYLAEIKGEKALRLLFTALKDPSAVVRRTAGDALSDIGDSLAMEPMINALKDTNKLVRWRAARFMYELGDERAILPLRQVQEDSEFEVSLQAKLALERIESGEEARGTVWQQMTQRNK